MLCVVLHSHDLVVLLHTACCAVHDPTCCMEKKAKNSEQDGGGRRSTSRTRSVDRSRSTSSSRVSVEGSQRGHTSSVHGIHSFRKVPQSIRGKQTSSHSPRRRSKPNNSGQPTRYIGGISRSSLCIFLLAVSSTAFVTTFSLYMVFTVYGPTNLVVYSGDAVKIAYSSSWCKSFRCQEKAVNDSTELIQLLPSSDLVERERFVSYGPLPLRENTDHLLVLPVSDGAKIDVSFSIHGWCVDSAILIFQSLSAYDSWLDTSRSKWLSRVAASCSGDRWSLVAVNGGELIIVIRPLGLKPGYVAVGHLNATVRSLAVANESVVGVVCSALNASCSIGLAYRAQFDYAVAANPVSSDSALADSYDSMNDGVVSKVRCECSSRTGLYFGVFGGVDIAAILIIAAVFSFRKWRLRRSAAIDMSTARPSDTSNAGNINGPNCNEETRLLEDCSGSQTINAEPGHGSDVPT